jgi:class 3 adenylate cyclase
MVIRCERRAHVAARREALWPLVADTERLNAAIGLPAVRFEVATDDLGAFLRGTVRWLGIPVASWVEHPFDWDEPAYYSVRREFDGGLFRQVVAGVDLLADAAGTLVRAWTEITPRNGLGAIIARWVLGPRGTARIIQQCRLFEEYLRGQRSSPFPQLRPRTGVNQGRLAQLCDQLAAQGCDRALLDRLRRQIADAPDADVVGMRPFELADHWGVDRRALLSLCFYATAAGLLALRWHVMCPACRVTKAQVPSLRLLERGAYCDTCGMEFAVDFDHLVEVRFDVAPDVRRATRLTHCIGGPLNSPHVRARATVAPQEQRTLAVSLEPRPYRLRAAPVGTTELTVSAVGQSTTTVHVVDDGCDPPRAEVRPGEVAITVANRSRSATAVTLEDPAWSDKAATAALTGTVPAFRKLFSAEVLAPGLEVPVANLAFLFTDLVGSTALYERIGEGRAFRLVQEHFRILDAAVEAHDGAVVKTIGDAVMAVFPSGRDALAAAVDIQQGILRLNTEDVADATRLIRVGVHAGPCVAVTLNGRLDYFGTTINTTARIEHECGGGEIVASAMLCDAPAAREFLQARSTTVEPFVAQLRGLPAPMDLRRIRCSTPTAGAPLAQRQPIDTRAG